MAAAIDRHAVEAVGLDAPLADLLVRLFLAPENHLRGVEISQQLLIDPSRTSRLLDRAEATGIVVRTVDPADRRAQRITLTDSGRRKLEEFLPRLLAVLDRTVFDVLSEEELKALQSTLKKVERAARSLADRDGFAPSPEPDQL